METRFELYNYRTEIRNFTDYREAMFEIGELIHETKTAKEMVCYVKEAKEAGTFKANNYREPHFLPGTRFVDVHIIHVNSYDDNGDFEQGLDDFIINEDGEIEEENYLIKQYKDINA